MSVETLPEVPTIIYPESDGAPMADNTLQFRWIVTIQGGLDALFAERADVFVAGDLLWYPVEGRPDLRRAPDAMVVFGRPKGDRGSYRQWVESGIAPQVVFEVLSPGNSGAEMLEKLAFYARYGVEEYYVYDPHHGAFGAHVRQGDQLAWVNDLSSFVSSRTGLRFSLAGNDLVITRPDGERFESYLELEAARRAERERAEAERERAEAERERAEAERERAEAERERADRLAAKLRALGLDPENEESL